MRLPHGGICHWGIIVDSRKTFRSEDYIFVLRKAILYNLIFVLNGIPREIIFSVEFQRYTVFSSQYMAVYSRSLLEYSQRSWDLELGQLYKARR